MCIRDSTGAITVLGGEIYYMDVGGIVGNVQGGVRLTGPIVDRAGDGDVLNGAGYIAEQAVVAGPLLLDRHSRNGCLLYTSLRAECCCFFWALQINLHRVLLRHILA